MSENDFLSFFYAGNNVIFDLPNLYNSLLSPFPFRYFPISAYFFTPFSMMGLEIGYFVFQVINFFLNILIIYLMYKIIQRSKILYKGSKFNYELNSFKETFNREENESILHQYGVFLIALPSFMNYFLGQINIIVSIFILSSLYFFLKGNVKDDFIGGILLGLGIMIRPTLILLLPFLLILNYNRKNKRFTFKLKRTVIRLLGTVILIMVSGIYFIIYPQMFSDFINVNLTGEYTYAIEGGIEINPSFSLTRIVLIFFELINAEVSGFLIFSIITLIILIPIYFLYIQDTDHPLNLINGYFVGLTVLLIVYFDSWPHHIVVLAPFIIFFLLMNKNFKFYRMVKYLHYLIAILIVIFWGIFYLTYQLLPFNIG
ncbi:MAG: glycosyltransferase 87 family protein, partial [Candidatus Lokiarchaeia archaeon]|nr:glycosyltransferase 87 family protein [Candidatus Lokiarchaeia archaeon]